MKRFITPLMCIVIGIAVGWYWGYTRSTAKDYRELLKRYDWVRENLHMSDEQMADFGRMVPQYFEDVRRQDEEAARFALGAFQILEKGETERAKQRLLQAVGSYYHVYHDKGGDSNLVVKIEEVAHKYPALAAEISRKVE